MELTYLEQLSVKGRKFSKALARFIKQRRIEFALDIAKRQIEHENQSRNPLRDSDDDDTEDGERNKVIQTAEAISNSQFTIWTSMLKRSMQTAESFDPEEYDIKVPCILFLFGKYIDH